MLMTFTTHAIDLEEVISGQNKFEENLEITVLSLP